MMKRMLIFICLIASIGSTFAEVQFGGRNDPDSTKPVDCKTDDVNHNKCENVDGVGINVRNWLFAVKKFV